MLRTAFRFALRRAPVLAFALTASALGACGGGPPATSQVAAAPAPAAPDAAAPSSTASDAAATSDWFHRNGMPTPVATVAPRATPTPTPAKAAATPSAAPTSGAVSASPPAASGTIVWQTGNAAAGTYVVPSTADGQCAGIGPSITGNTATFTVLRNTAGSYTYNGNSYPGASTCYRNQMNPVGNGGSGAYLLTLGAHYVWTFQTVVTFNGNSVYEGASDGGLAVDIPAIVWQTHSYGGDGSPCDTLVLQNTYVASVNGITQYGSVPQGGKPTWNFHTCDESDFTGNAYNSPDTLYDGETDAWEIDATPEVIGSGGGSIVVKRNGQVVYNAASHICDSSTPQCFWNFGPYPFFWENTEEPPGWNSAGLTVQFNNMTLVKQ